MKSQIVIDANMPTVCTRLGWFWFVASYPQLGVFSQGITRRSAHRKLNKTVGGILSAYIESGLMDEFMERCGLTGKWHLTEE